MGWIPLHVHSEYSTLDGAIKIKDYVDWADKHNLPAIAVTDHGFLSSIPALAKAIKAKAKYYKDNKTEWAGIKPIFGMEAYVDSVTNTGQKYHHMVILVRNRTGLNNLYRMSSMSYEENMKGKFGVIRPEWIKEYGEGLIFLSACMQGELPYLLRTGNDDKVPQFIDFMKGLDFFVELVDIGTPEQDALNARLSAVAEHYNLKAVVTPDAHYFAEDRWWYPTFWTSNRHFSDTYEEKFDDMSRMDLSLPLPEEMERKYPKEAANTCLVADMIEDVKIGFDKHMMPKLSVETDLRTTAEAGLEEKIRKYGLPRQEYTDRLNYELELLEKMGFSDYMLLVRDIVKTAREKSIYVGPGRGSAAGSLTAWALDITAVDPIRHGLMFERFINPGRTDSFPDIDIDIEHERREEVIETLKKKYGHNAVAGIITFSEYKIKNAVWDVLRAMFGKVEAGSDAEQFKKIVGEEIRQERDPETNTVKEEYIDEEAIYRRTADIMPREKAEEIIETAKKIISLHRSLGRHAAGIVITPGNTEDFCPTARVKSGDELVKITQFDMEGIDEVKLVKMDILGLKNLTAIREVYETARHFDKTVENPEDIYDFLNGARNLPEDRVKRMWAVISKKPDGVFQLFSWKAKQIVSRVKPTNVGELCDILALNRPGPLAKKLDEYYIEKKTPEDLNLPEIKEITADTRHVLIYQEQVMKVAQKIAGFSLADADTLRKVVGKKKPEEMKDQKEKFVKGAIENGYTAEQAEAIFSVIEKFAGYAFNKSHSMAYSYLTCITAWQKANYPAMWAKAFLNMKREKDKKESLGEQIDIANEICPVYGPQITKKDKTLGDAMEMRIIRQAGIDVPEKDSFWLKNSWALFFGLEDIYQVRKQVRKFANFPVPNNLRELWELAVKYRMTKSVFAPLFCLGVFDKALECGRDTVLLRAVMMLNKDEEAYERAKEAVYEIMPRIKKSPEEKLSGYFTFMSLFLLMISAGKYTETAEKILEIYARKADEDRFFEDPEFRNKCISVIYETEKQLLGDGLTVKWWDMAAESIKYRFTCFADCVQVMKLSKHSGIQDHLRSGFWTIGKAYVRDGRVKLVGRNGAAGYPVIFFINDEKAKQGIWAVKLRYDGKYFRYVKHIDIDPGSVHETDNALCYRDDRMPERLKTYIERNNPGLTSVKGIERLEDYVKGRPSCGF